MVHIDPMDVLGAVGIGLTILSSCAVYKGYREFDLERYSKEFHEIYGFTPPGNMKLKHIRRMAKGKYPF